MKIARLFYHFSLLIFMSTLIFQLGACNFKLNQEHPQITKGNKLYMKYCMECHGQDGKGISALKEQYEKVDLTLINSRRKIDKFPIEEIANYIDGRNHYKEFGPRPMPMWGIDLMTRENNYNPDTSRSNLGAIISYLITLQE